MLASRKYHDQKHMRDRNYEQQPDDNTEHYQRQEEQGAAEARTQLWLSADSNNYSPKEFKVAVSYLKKKPPGKNIP